MHIHTQHISYPILTWLKSHHLPLSKPAVFNIKYPQDVPCPCMDSDASDLGAAPLPHKHLAYCLVNHNPTNPVQKLLLLRYWNGSSAPRPTDVRWVQTSQVSVLSVWWWHKLTPVIGIWCMQTERRGLVWNGNLSRAVMGSNALYYSLTSFHLGDSSLR